jgi:hypothetical protein
VLCGDVVGAQVVDMVAHSDLVNFVRFNPTSDRLATASHAAVRIFAIDEDGARRSASAIAAAADEDDGAAAAAAAAAPAN